MIYQHEQNQLTSIHFLVPTVRLILKPVYVEQIQVFNWRSAICHLFRREERFRIYSSQNKTEKQAEVLWKFAETKNANMNQDI